MAIIVPIGAIAVVDGLGSIRYYDRTTAALLLTRTCAVNGQILRAPVRGDGVWGWDDGNTTARILNSNGTVRANVSSLPVISLTQGGFASGQTLFATARVTFTTFYTSRFFIVTADGVISAQWDVPALGIGAGSPETSDTLVHQFYWGLSWNGSAVYYSARNRNTATDYKVHIAPVGGGLETLVSQPSAGYAAIGSLGLQDGTFVTIWSHIGNPVPPHGLASGGTGAKQIVHYSAVGATLSAFSVPSTLYNALIADIDETSVWASDNGTALKRFRLSDGVVLNTLALSMVNTSPYGAIGNAFTVRVPISDTPTTVVINNQECCGTDTSPGATNAGNVTEPILGWTPSVVGDAEVTQAPDLVLAEAWDF